MATETEEICPICRDVPRNETCTMPCGHQFCLGCILRWVYEQPQCPLCRQPVEKVRFRLFRENHYLSFVIRDPEEMPDTTSQEDTDPSRPAENSPNHPVASPAPSPQGPLSPDEEGTAGPEAEAVGGIMPEVWAQLFQRLGYVLGPVLLPWLRQELQEICGPRWWQAYCAEADILHTLCVSGPDAEALVQVVQPELGEDAAPLVHGIISIIEDECSQQAWNLVHNHSVWEDDASSGAGSSPTSSSSTSPSPTSYQWGIPSSYTSSSSSSAGSDGEEEAVMLEAALCGDPGHQPSAPVPAEQEQSQEEPGQEAVAGPSAQGCSRSPSSPGHGRDGSTGSRRRPPKRRAPSPQDSPQPCKRPPRRQH
ncbi:TOPRS ligase, partial [Glaucidium brasilianum]|nr:TOPRS ligase [Glaucidium brasilianum]